MVSRANAWVSRRPHPSPQPRNDGPFHRIPRSSLGPRMWLSAKRCKTEDDSLCDSERIPVATDAIVAVVRQAWMVQLWRLLDGLPYLQDTRGYSGHQGSSAPPAPTSPLPTLSRSWAFSWSSQQWNFPVLEISSLPSAQSLPFTKLCILRLFTTNKAALALRFTWVSCICPWLLRDLPC